MLICWGLAGPNCSAARQYCALIGESRVKLGLRNGTCCGFLVEGCRERPLCEPLMFLGRASGSADSFTREELENHFTICTRDCNSFTLNPEERNTHTHDATLREDERTHKHPACVFSMVEHLPHIKNKFIASQFGKCLAMQGKNTIPALGIADCSPALQGILFVYLFGVIKNTMMNAYFFQMNNLKGLAADESRGSVSVE